MSADDYAGLRVLVTGGASGIGHAVAAAGLRRGAKVAVLDLDPSGAHTGAVALHADATDDASVAEAVETAASTMGGIDVLVNNAGIGAQGTIETNPLDAAGSTTCTALAVDGGMAGLRLRPAPTDAREAAGGVPTQSRPFWPRCHSRQRCQRPRNTQLWGNHEQAT
jgi:shikimate 5-dehydrogenase